MQKEESKKMKLIGNLYGDRIGTGMAGNVWDSKGLCPTIQTMQGGVQNAFDN